MQTGTVKSWFDQKGWGFLAIDGGGKDCFVHYTNVETVVDGRRSLKVGQVVRFDVEMGPKGKPQACNVCVIEEVEHAGASTAVQQK